MLTDVDEAAVERVLATHAPPGMAVGCRVIAAGDAAALLPEERSDFERCVEAVRRRSGSARVLARRLLAAAGFAPVPLPRSQSGSPVWPQGVVGSLAHDDEVAVAALARTSAFAAIGIDVEPAVDLPGELVPLVTTSVERKTLSAELVRSRVPFAVKEAVYKALHPIDGIFLDFHDIEIDVDARIARTRTGRTVAIAFATSPRVLALAWVPRGQTRAAQSVERRAADRPFAVGKTSAIVRGAAIGSPGRSSQT